MRARFVSRSRRCNVGDQHERDREARRVKSVLDALRLDDLRRRKTARRLVREAYGKRPQCVYCGGGANTADHIVPKAKGGGQLLTNLVPACLTCNGKKRDDAPAEYFAKFPKAAREFARRAVHADPDVLTLAAFYGIG